MALHSLLIAAVLALALVGCGTLPTMPVTHNTWEIPTFGR